MSCNWPLIKIDDLKSNTKGSIAIGPFGSRMKSDCYVDEGIPVIRGTNITGGPDFKGEFVFITEEKADELGSCNVYKNDLVFPHRGAIGEVGIVLGDERYVLSSSLMKLSCNTEKVNPQFLYYFFKSRLGRHELLKNASQVGTPGIGQPLTSLKGIELRLPPLPIQDQIAETLSSLSQKIVSNDQTNQTLEQMAQAIFKSWFVDFDPVKAKMNGDQPEGMDAATASLFPEKLVESEFGLIPEGWEAKPLGDYLTIKRGGSPRPIKDFIVPEGYPWTKIADATANDNPYIFKTKEFIKEEGLKKTVYLKKGTLILSNSATPGLPRFLELDACIHDGWLHFPEKKHFTDSYLYQLFLHIRKHLVAQGNGSVFTNLKTDILRNQVVLVPPKELVDIYEKHASKFLETVKTKSIESNQLAQLRDTLLPKLLSGEIELGQAQELAEVE
ncbi:restriction endonuclease subunit S [Vibrio parahaemolyticus]|uniref:restriction endonuclease subunit S n=1 Tax=Vibrio parahaemolyticus TaxID=670 RepID=UPI000427AB3A|nr:restriction endonuclease subunit S [Vibrio parahaemolyticus]HCH6235467.1 restriction endonuclease subunit S [Vibrio parahaemolyticus]HCM1464910.1 restriction endonuclease subunit S [Vibrio parahaemolyticus]